MSGLRTLGVEEELHVVDRTTGRLTATASRLLRRLPTDGFAAELQRSTVETNTAVCTTLAGLRAEIVRLRSLADEVAADEGCAVMASGSAPLSAVEDFQLTAQGRYGRMQQDYRVLVDDQLICGLQVHVGVPDRDLAVRVAQRVAPDLPTLLAMSASSPYWNGDDTGYASFRTLVWQRWPSAGSFGQVENAADYDRLVGALIDSGVLSDAGMAYFDVRPSAHVPTVELRVCDACPVADDAVLIAGLFRALVDEAVDADAAGAPLNPRPEPVHRAAMWRAARSGLAGPLLGPEPAPVPAPSVDVVTALVDRLRPRLEAAGDWEDVRQLAQALVGRGDSASRQRDRFALRGRLSDVVGLVVAETRGRATSAVPRAALTDGYDGTPRDEALGASGVPHPAYRRVIDVLDDIGAEELHRREERARAAASARGLTVGVDGDQRPVPVDLVPRIVTPHEWSVLTAGLTQRARALELFLRDVYGPARVLADGLLDRATVTDGPHWRPSACDLPDDTVRAAVIGFDLVRDELAGWRVLGDNTRVPAGIGRALAMRRLLADTVPELFRAELFRGVGLRDPATVIGRIGDTLRALTDRCDPVVALLSGGATNASWREHRLIAEGAGLLLVQPDEITVDDRGVRAGGRRVDVLYLRLEGELDEVRSSTGAPVGSRILDAAVRGRVRLANAPGSGAADDRALFAMVPDLISYYLGERPLLAPVPTYRCANSGERELVLDRLDELVTKPVHGRREAEVLIGPAASADELADRRRAIEAHPRRWIAQEVVALSTHPVLGADRLEPRHVDLRAFVLLTGTGPDDARLADLALTRVAPAGSMVVNSSTGGGAKDTWLLADPLPDDNGR
jgi:glutamate---cysteine ligase / carboxylate-amine ligase